MTGQQRNMILIVLTLGVLSVGLILLAGCAPQHLATPMPSMSPAVVTAAGPTTSITILHTNDVMGEIDPCG